MWAWYTGWLGFDKGEEEKGTFIHWSSVWGEDTGRQVLCRFSGCLTDMEWSIPAEQVRVEHFSLGAWRTERE